MPCEHERRQLGATGNLQSTTQAQYLASKASGSFAAKAAGLVALAATQDGDAAQDRNAAESRALLDDEDLDAYFEVRRPAHPVALALARAHSPPARLSPSNCRIGSRTTRHTRAAAARASKPSGRCRAAGRPLRRRVPCRARLRRAHPRRLPPRRCRLDSATSASPLRGARASSTSNSH